MSTTPAVIDPGAMQQELENLPGMGAAQSAAVRRVAATIGEQPERITVVDPRWAEKLTDAVLVDLDIGRNRFETRLSYEMLGLHPETPEQRNAMDRTLTLGRGFLKPKHTVLHEFDKLENRARGALDDYAIKTTWGRLVPAANYLALKQVLEQLQGQYFALADTICTEDKWDEHYKIVLADYILLGFRTYRSLSEANARAAAAGRPAVAQLPESEEEFARNFAQRVMSNLPSRTAARASYLFTWSLAYVPMATMMAEDQMAASQVIVDREAATEEARALARARAQMRADLERTAGKAREDLVMKLYEDVQVDIRDRVYNMTVDVLAALRKNDGHLPPSNVRQLKDVIDAVKGLNLFDDEELHRQEQTIRLMMVARPTGANDGITYSQVMEKISAESRLRLLQLGRRPSRSAREFGVPDEVGELTEMLAKRAPRRVRMVLTPPAPDAVVQGPARPARGRAAQPAAV